MRSIFITLTALLVAALLVFGIFSGAFIPVEKVSRQGATLTIKGEINNAMVSRVMQLGLIGVDLVQLESIAGSEDAALELAELFEEHEVDIQVTGPCFGPCALYVFAAGEMKAVGSGGLLGCGLNSVAGMLVPEQIYGVSFDSDDIEVSRRAAAYLKRRGVSEAFAMNCLMQVQTHCYTTISEHNVSRSLAAVTSFELWVPLAEDLRAFGFTNVSGVPTATEEVKQGVIPEPMRHSWLTGGTMDADFLREWIPGLAQRCPEGHRPARRIISRID